MMGCLCTGNGSSLTIVEKLIFALDQMKQTAILYAALETHVRYPRTMHPACWYLRCNNCAVVDFRQSNDERIGSRSILACIHKVRVIVKISTTLV